MCVLRCLLQTPRLLLLRILSNIGMIRARATPSPSYRFSQNVSQTFHSRSSRGPPRVLQRASPSLYSTPEIQYFNATLWKHLTNVSRDFFFRLFLALCKTKGWGIYLSTSDQENARGTIRSGQLCLWKIAEKIQEGTQCDRCRCIRHFGANSAANYQLRYT